MKVNKQSPMMVSKYSSGTIFGPKTVRSAIFVTNSYDPYILLKEKICCGDIIDFIYSS